MEDTTIDEKVKVWAFFDNGVFPIAMNWQRRLVKFRRLIFSSTHRVGQNKIVNLICESDSANYELEFDTSNYSWTVKKVINE